MAKTHAKTNHRRAPGAVIPKTMRAVVVTGFGGPEVVEVREVPVPRPGPHEALIHVVTAGIGSWDAKLKSGDWGKETPMPVTLGADGSGVVVAVGPRTRALKVGDQVFASSYLNPKGGFHAEYVCLHENAAAKKPQRLTLDEAGAIATTGLTALQGVERLHIRLGDVILIFGATGGVGTLAVQFAKLKGARVIATGSGDALAYVHSIGADAGFDPRRQGAEGLAHAMEALGARHLDGVLALASSDVLQAAIERVVPGGRIVYPHGVEPEPKGNESVDVIAYNGEPGPEAFEALTEAVERCPGFEARIDDEFALEDAGQAYEQVGQGGVLGRIVLRVDPRRVMLSRWKTSGRSTTSSSATAASTTTRRSASASRRTAARRSRSTRRSAPTSAAGRRRAASSRSSASS